jgi:hypothetical protein
MAIFDDVTVSGQLRANSISTPQQQVAGSLVIPPPEVAQGNVPAGTSLLVLAGLTPPGSGVCAVPITSGSSTTSDLAGIAPSIDDGSVLPPQGTVIILINVGAHPITILADNGAAPAALQFSAADVIGAGEAKMYILAALSGVTKWVGVSPTGD